MINLYGYILITPFKNCLNTGSGAKPQWVGNEGEALPVLTPEFAVCECTQPNEGL